jgi:hypothetical protein
MRPALTSIAVAALLTIAVGTAFPQPMTGPGPFVRGAGLGVSGQGGNDADPGAYLFGLKGALGITPAQEPAWTEYADMVKGVTWQMQRVRELASGAIDTATPQERHIMMDRVSQAQQRAFDTVHEAAEELLAALDPMQRNKAEDCLPGLAGQSHRMMEQLASGPRAR